MELLVVIPISLIVITVVMMLYLVSARSEKRTFYRTESTVHAKNGLARMTRELRQAKSVTSTGGSNVTAHNVCNGYQCSTLHTTTYSCTQDACTRLSCTSSAPPTECTPSGTAVPVVGGTLNPDVKVVNDQDVFALYSRDPTGALVLDPLSATYVTIRLKVGVKNVTAGDAKSPIVYEDGFDLPNTAS
jgi:hypothetical protein